MNILDEKTAFQVIKNVQNNENSKLIEDVTFPLKYKWPATIFRNIFFKNINFNSPFFQGNFLSRIKFFNCKFFNSCFEGHYISKAEFSDCTFEKVIFGSRYVGIITSSIFNRCSFTNCKISSVEIKKSEFLETQIMDSILERVIFRESVFKNFKIDSRVKFSSFIGCSFFKSDLSTIKFSELTIMDIGERGFLLPDSPKGFAINAVDFVESELVLKELIGESSLRILKEFVRVFSTSNFLELVFIDETMFSEVNSEDRKIIINYLFSKRIKGNPPFAE